MNHESIFAIKDQQKECDATMFIQDISRLKTRVNTSAPSKEVFGLQESDEDNIYNLPAEASKDDFWGEDF